MTTDIAFLEDLGEDLVSAGYRELRYTRDQQRRGLSKRLVVALAAATLVLAGAIGYVVTRPGSGPQEALHSLIRRAGRNPAPQLVQGGSHAPTRPAFRPDLRDLARMAPETAVGAPPALYGSVHSPPGVSLATPRIVKTASAAIVVKRGTFMTAFNQASSIAAASGGFVQTSSTEGAPARYGTLEVRVPANRFDQTLSELRALGTVQSQSISGQDVTSRYVDLQARIRTWQSQEQALLRLMARTSTIGETLSIQNRLQQVLLTIEQLQGQLRVLRDQTSNASISVTLSEAGVPRPVHHQQSINPSFGGGWNRGVAGFLAVLVAVMIGLGYLIPIAALGALVWLAVRGLRRRILA